MNKKKICLKMSVVVPTDDTKSVKEREKLEECLDFFKEVKQVSNLKRKSLPIITGGLETLQKILAN